jgi:hypothetical protein
VNAFPGDVRNDFLSELAHEHALFGEIGKGRGDADDVAFGDLALETEQQVGRGKVEEMQRVRLDNLPIVEEAAQLLGGRCQGPEAGDDVHRLGRRQEVAHRADAAQALHRDRNFPVGPPTDEDFEAAKLDDMQPDLMNPILLVEEDRHLAVSLDPGDGLDGDAAQLVRRLGGFEIEHGERPSVVVQQGMVETRHAPQNQIVEILPDRVGGRRAAGNEIVDPHDLVDGVDLVEKQRQLGIVGDMRGPAVRIAIDPLRMSPTSSWLRNAGSPPLIAQAPMATRILALARISRRTCTFSALQQPPSIRAMSQGPQCLMSVIGERSKSAIFASSRMGSSMSRNDM